MGLTLTTLTYLNTKAYQIRENREITAITPFKAIQGHHFRYQLPIESLLSTRLPIYSVFQKN